MPFTNQQLKNIIADQEKQLEQVFDGLYYDDREGLCSSIDNVMFIDEWDSERYKNQMFDFLQEKNIARYVMFLCPVSPNVYYHDVWKYNECKQQRINFYLFRIYCVEYYRVFLYGDT